MSRVFDKPPQILEIARGDFYDPSFRDVRSPIDFSKLSPLDPRCKRIQFDSTLCDEDHRRVSRLLEEYPWIELRDYDRDKENVDYRRHYPRLRKYTLEGSRLNDINGLSCLSTDLESLGFGQTRTKKHSLRFLERFPRLQNLWIEGHVKDFDATRHLHKLKRLSVRSITLPNLEVVGSLPRLESLEIKLGGTKNLALLPRLTKLRYLELWLIRDLADLSVIAEVTSLQYLFLESLRNVKRLPSFAKLKNLRRLQLENMKGIIDLSPLLRASALEELTVINCPNIQPSHFRQIAETGQLKRIYYWGGNQKKAAEVSAMFNLPESRGKWTFEYI